MGSVEITTWYLEQDDPALIRPARPPAEPVEIIRAELPSPELNRFLYTAVGGDWSWSDRLPWTWRQWQEWLDRPGVETWVALRNAWSLADRHEGFPPVERVTVNTCSLDGPAALTNYQARGLSIQRTETKPSDSQQPDPGPWPGAGTRFL